jgi:hypothetical protein
MQEAKNIFGESEQRGGEHPSETEKKIWREYPNLAFLSEKIKPAVSSAYVNIRTVESYLEKVQRSESTASVEAHLDLVGENLSFLKKEISEFLVENSSIPPSILDLIKFVRDHEVLLTSITKKAKAIIGSKKREDVLEGGDGVYK